MRPSKRADLRLISDEPVATLADDRLGRRRHWVLPQDNYWKKVETSQDARRHVRELIVDPTWALGCEAANAR